MSKFKVIFGKVTIRITDGSSERFINLCRHRGIRLEHIVSKNGFTQMVLPAKDFKEVCEIASKAGNKLKIIKKKGISFIAFKYRKHYSFAAGILLCILFVYACSLFLFNITFSGNQNLTVPVLMKYLENIGIKNGCPVASIDCDVLEKKMREDFDEITWVAAAVKGNHLYISIKENDSFEGEIKGTGSPCSIISQDDGTVESIITRSGTPLVKKGDEVVKGQVLVSGVVDIYNDSGEVIAKKGVESDADIYIRSETQYHDELNENYEIKEFTGRTRKNKIICLGKYVINIGFEKPGFALYDIKDDYKILKISDDLYLPASTGQRIFYEYKLSEYTYSDEEASDILKNRLERLFLQSAQKGVQIAQERVKILKNNGVYTCDGTLVFISPQTKKEALSDDELNMPGSEASEAEKKESSQ